MHIPNEPTIDADDFLAKLDIEAIADPNDKVRECEFFLGLASVEPSRERFRWLITAYLNAVYSFCENSALYANAAFTHSKTGEPIADDESLEKLRAYVKVFTYVSTPAIPEGPLSGIQYFERNLKFRCPIAVVRH